MSKVNHGFHFSENCADPSPYPEVKVAGPNPCYACMLMDDYAGVVSEFTAISQYLYQHFFFTDIDKKLGKLLKKVSINEMHHMEILADIIKELGGDPRIRGSFSTCNNYWNGSFVNYSRELCDQLKADIDAEHQAISAYRKRIRLIQDSNIQAILQRIILDEKVHIRLFNEALYKHCGCVYRPID